MGEFDAGVLEYCFHSYSIRALSGESLCLCPREEDIMANPSVAVWCANKKKEQECSAGHLGLARQDF